MLPLKYGETESQSNLPLIVCWAINIPIKMRLSKVKGLCLSLSLFSATINTIPQANALVITEKKVYFDIKLWSRVQRPHLLLALLLAEPQVGREHHIERT